MKTIGSVSAKSRKTAATSANESTQGGPKGAKDKKDNDWIPTEAVRAILELRDFYKEKMTETCISQILYRLNSIWREIMRKENTAIKKRLTAQI
jgi:arsenate reductase-like glutaredoxin family protein